MIRSTRKPQCKKPSFDVRHDARIETPGKLLNESLHDLESSDQLQRHPVVDF